MNAAGSPPSLRPLGVGEVLDRAVTLCVKHFRLLATIFVVYAVPLAIAQFFAGRDVTTIMTNLQTALTAGAASGKPADPTIIAHALKSIPAAAAWYPLVVGLTIIVVPLPTAALVDACAAFYLGRSTTFEGAYRAAFSAWRRLIVLNLIYFGAGLLLYVALILAVIAIAFAVVLVTAAVKILGIIITVILVVSLSVAGIGFAIVATLAWQVSIFTCVVEHATPWSAFKLGVRRVFVGVGLRRSLLVGIAYFAILLGISLVTVVGAATLIGLVHNAFVGDLYGATINVATAAFTTAFVAIFYFDLRVREEGLDLQLEAANARALVAPSV